MKLIKTKSQQLLFSTRTIELYQRGEIKLFVIKTHHGDGQVNISFVWDDNDLFNECLEKFNELS